MEMNAKANQIRPLMVAIAALVSLVLMLSMVPAAAFAGTMTTQDIVPTKDESNNGHSWSWRLEDNGVLWIHGAVDLGRGSNPNSEDVPWYEYRDKITSVRFLNNPSLHGDVSSLFSGCYNLGNVGLLRNVDTSDVTSMADMFSGCNVLGSLDLSNFDTSRVTDMSFMFSDCNNLTSLDLSNFDTSKVVDMTGMFADCWGLQSLDVSKFNTSRVTNLTGMFTNCRSLTSLDVSRLDTSMVTSMGGMFYGCSSLASLSLSGLDTSNVTDLNQLFYNCSSLKSLDLSGFDTSKVVNVQDMFYYNRSLTELRLGSKWKPAAGSTGLSDGWYEDRDCDGYADKADRTLTGLQVLVRGSDGLAKIGYVKSSELKPAASTKPTDSDRTSANADNGTSAAAIVENRVLTAKTDKDVAGSTFAILQARASKATKTSVTLKWTRVKGATKYVVYGNKCGKKNRYVKVKTVKATKKNFKQKGLKSKTYYKFIVVAVGNANGTEVALATSKTIHVATKGSSKRANPTKVTVSRKRVSLKQGKSAKLMSKQSKKKGTKVSTHRKVAFESSNPDVATVSSKGKVTAKKKGRAYVFAYAQNGIFARVTVVVK